MEDGQSAQVAAELIGHVGVAREQLLGRERLAAFESEQVLVEDFGQTSVLARRRRSRRRRRCGEVMHLAPQLSGKPFAAS